MAKYPLEKNKNKKKKKTKKDRESAGHGKKIVGNKLSQDIPKACSPRPIQSLKLPFYGGGCLLALSVGNTVPYECLISCSL